MGLCVIASPFDLTLAALAPFDVSRDAVSIPANWDTYLQERMCHYATMAPFHLIEHN